ncbi:TonB family protein [Spirosoma sp.]|uniref:TonB family protein n=1 Tax=Spirosoma sp. TaxID=1899569 RepID=UPI003B3A9F03
MSTLDYFLKANLYGLLFVSCYWLFLRQHTFFGLNRVYLLASTLLTLLLPRVNLPTQTVETLPVPVGVITLPVTTIATLPTETGPDWETIFLTTYGIVSAVLLLRLMLRTGRLLRFIHRSPLQRIDDYVLVRPTNSLVPTFSFFHYLVLNPDDAKTAPIIDHELVHIRQHHSIDVLSLAILRAIFWACPALWLIDKMLRQVHEFLADKAITQPTYYAHFLVNYAFGIQPDTLVNGFFNPSLLKQRVQMLHQKATTRWALGKYVLVIPLALGLLSMTTAREEISAMIDQVNDERITVSGVVTNAADGKPLPGSSIVVKGGTLGTSTDASGKYTLSNVPRNSSLVFSFVGFTSQVVPVNGHSSIHVSMAMGAIDLNVSESVTSPGQEQPVQSQNGAVFTVVEQQPEFPGGMQALRKYLAENLRYPAEARQKRVQGRVFLQFVVSSTGQIQDLRLLKGIGSGCDEEAVRVVSQMPAWKPGRQQGNPVNVMYNLPIQFALKKAEDKRTGRITSPAQPDSAQRMSVIIDNSKNGKFALYNDVKEPVIPLPDSLPPPYPKPSIKVRGYSAGLSAEPLYIVDGAEQPRGKKLNLDANTIQSVTVLKGESASSVYGAKGINGVVLITSRKK